MQIYHSAEKHDNFVRLLVLLNVLVKLVVVNLNSKSDRKGNIYKQLNKENQNCHHDKECLPFDHRSEKFKKEGHLNHHSQLHDERLHDEGLLFHETPRNGGNQKENARQNDERKGHKSLVEGVDAHLAQTSICRFLIIRRTLGQTLVLVEGQRLFAPQTDRVVVEVAPSAPLFTPDTHGARQIPYRPIRTLGQTQTSKEELEFAVSTSQTVGGFAFSAGSTRKFAIFTLAKSVGVHGSFAFATLRHAHTTLQKGFSREGIAPFAIKRT